MDGRIADGSPEESLDFWVSGEGGGPPPGLPLHPKPKNPYNPQVLNPETATWRGGALGVEGADVGR